MKRKTSFSRNNRESSLSTIKKDLFFKIKFFLDQKYCFIQTNNIVLEIKTLTPQPGVLHYEMIIQKEAKKKVIHEYQELTFKFM
jgi:hypothetical protein